MTYPTVILITISLLTIGRSRASWALAALACLDVAHVLVAGASDPWVLRTDATVAAGAWIAPGAVLLVGRSGLWFIAWGMAAVAVGRVWHETWLPLMLAPRFAVGLLAWRAKGHGRSFRIGQVIAACQVAAAAFLWSNWGDVRLLSAACWAACGLIIICRQAHAV